jgi:arylsulfatase A-like enzyme
MKSATEARRPDRDAGDVASGPRPMSAVDALILAAALGCVAGILETGMLAFAKFALGRYTHMNPQIVWLAPLFYALLFCVMTGLLLLVRTRWRSLPLLRAVTFVCVFFATAGVFFLLSRLHRGAALVLATGIATQASFVAPRIGGWLLPRVRRLAVGAAAVPLFCFIALNGAFALGERLGVAPLTAAGTAPNVLLIIWDTVRAASTGLYGYARPTTPALERLAASGVVFEHAFSAAPWTLPAHASMFTGLPPHRIAADWTEPLEDGPPTIADVLRRAGYRTGGFVANRFYVSRESGLHRGFLRYDVFPVFSAIDLLTASTLGRAIFNDVGWRHRLGMRQKPGRKYGEQVSDEFLDWLDGTDAARPFFAFLNYFDAHHPYLPPPPFDTMFGPLLPGRDPSMEEDRDWSARELQAEIDAYDGGIAYDDRELQRLLDALERRGLLDNTIVIVTSDHGEEFGEHALFTHGNSLYDPALRVPLVIAGAGVPRGVRVPRWVSTSDVAATIAHLTRTSERRQLGGESLARFWTPSAAMRADTLVAAVSYSSGHPDRYPVSRGDMNAVLAEPFKYIRTGDGSELLYDLRADPAERRDLHASPDMRSVLTRLRTFLDRAID